MIAVSRRWANVRPWQAFSSADSFQAVRSTWAMPTARHAGQARSRCELQRWRPFLAGHNWHPGPLARARRATARYDRHLHEQQPGHSAAVSPAQCPPPIPLTSASSRDNRLPPTHESHNSGLPRRGCHGRAARAERRIFAASTWGRHRPHLRADGPVLDLPHQPNCASSSWPGSVDCSVFREQCYQVLDTLTNPPSARQAMPASAAAR